MLQDNTRRVNMILARILGWCSLAIVALMFTTWIGFFHFNKSLKAIILVSGTAATLVPALLVKTKISDVFLKYYMMVALSILIALMGCNNGVGIYITYALVPIASCMYFDRNFMKHVSIISYITMTIGVYVNTAGKLEVIYKNWSHMLTFRNYMIGFTIEYVVVMLFLYELVNRAQSFMESQQENLNILVEEKERREKISELYRDMLPAHRRTAYDVVDSSSEGFSQEDYSRLAAGHRYIAQFQNILSYTDDTNEAYSRVFEILGSYFKLARIIYVERSSGNHEDRLAFQWCEKEKYRLCDFYTEISNAEAQAIIDRYDERGYIEYGFEFRKSKDFLDTGITRYMMKNLIGRNLWIPTIENGEYVGAFCFDKSDVSPYSPVDIFLLSEAVNTISIYLMRRSANEANRAKSTFLSTMSHEIRTPLNAIIGMSTVSLRENMSDSLRYNLEMIKSSSEGLLRIINDILDFSKIESGKTELILDNYSLKNLLDELKVLVDARNQEKKLRINYEFDDNLPDTLYGDVVRVRQVMLNLATNAIKYTDEGHVTIRVSTVELEDKVCMLKYSVEDTGQGIKDEDIDDLFRSFSQLNKQLNHHTEGTGLGLAISKQLIELMNGRIGVDSIYGEGSCFYFELPQKIVEGVAEDEGDTTPVDDSEIDLSDKKVLIVDDNMANLIVAQALMEPLGFDITVAEIGSKAIELTKSLKFDLIFMDYFMPEMDGDEVTKIIRQDSDNPNAETPIVALTADAIVGVKEKLLAAGMNDFLSKPIELKEVDRVVRKYLVREKPL